MENNNGFNEFIKFIKTAQREKLGIGIGIQTIHKFPGKFFMEK